MLWKTHIRISNEVLRRLGINLSSEVYSKFKDGILAPDQWKDFPHHHGKSEEIENSLMRARQWYLKEELLNAFYYLGVALHYIQDSYTSVISYRSPKNQMWHQNYEQYIENSDFVYNLENTIQYFFRNDSSQLNKYLALARNLSMKVEGKDATMVAATLSGRYPSEQTGKAKIDLNMALKASLVVVKSVVSSRECPELETKLNQVLEVYEGRLQESEVILVNEIVELVQKRDSLRGRIVPASGVKIKLKNGFLKVGVAIRNLQIHFKINQYDSKGHLRKVVKSYRKVTGETISPYVGWYNFRVPELRLSIVKMQLLLVQDVAKKLAVTVDVLEKSLEEAHCPIYRIKDGRLLRRSELNKFLSKAPLNGFTELPK
jgi:hypothetical protein